MNILLTGITGFIGGHVCQRLIDEGRHTLVGLVRPQTEAKRYARFQAAVRVMEADLTDAQHIEHIFEACQIEGVAHIAAVRGGGTATMPEFERSNIVAPTVLAQAALKQNAHFIFCSSVGVFGTIPAQLPPDEQTAKIGDNDYHASKIEAEYRLLALQEQGLRLTIIRPIITYGIGDNGFPFQLMALTDRGILPLPTQDIRIHLVNVHTLAQTFAQAFEAPIAIGKIYTVTDAAPISLRTLVDHISQRLHGRPYPAWKRCPTALYRLAEWMFSHLINNAAWRTRAQLMSRDWYYDGSVAVQELQLNDSETIPAIDAVIDWYQSRP